MSAFSKTFLRERIGDEKQPRKFFGAFGKHPGWDDHIEDLPLPTASMAAAKQLLYVQGIGSQISSGAWTRLADDVCLPGFDHLFLWLRGRQFLAGRMWASRDGKRRAHFPMIALVHGINGVLDPALGALFAQLEGVAAGCQAARSAEEVRLIVSEASGAMPDLPEEAAPADVAEATLPVPRTGVAQFAADFHENLPPHSRVPADPTDVLRSLRFWSRVCPALAPADLPLLFLAPRDQPWIDVLVGEPAPPQFLCLRAGLAALPLVFAETSADSAMELDAADFLKNASGSPASAGERSWISRLLRH